MSSNLLAPRLVPRSAPAREALTGARTMTPLLVGLVPFALLLGGVVGASVNPSAAWAGTLPIYGGSAQLAVLEPLGRGASLWVAALAGVLVNLRVVVYSTALAPLWSGSRWWLKLVAAATAIDQTWMVAEHRAGQPGTMTERRAHYVGAAGVLTVGWLAAVSVGALSVHAVGVTKHLALALPLCLTVLVVPHLRRPGGAAAVAAAAGVVVLMPALPPGAVLPLAMGAAAVAGTIASRWWSP
jgi:predicted branched-subunit amino acid permease